MRRARRTLPAPVAVRLTIVRVLVVVFGFALLQTLLAIAYGTSRGVASVARTTFVLGVLGVVTAAMVVDEHRIPIPTPRRLPLGGSRVPGGRPTGDR